MLPGIAALLVNGVEHGLCGIGFDRKGELLRTGNWRREVDRLCRAQPAERAVEVTFGRREDGDIFAVTDPGPGFDWKAASALETSGAGSSHGRGLIQARRMSFDKLTFNAAGNQAVGIVHHRSELEW